MADDAHVLVAQHARRHASAATPASPRGLSLQGGGVGLLKSLREERPTLRVKAVDVDPGAPLSPSRRRAAAGARARRRPSGSRLPGRRANRVPHAWPRSSPAVAGARRATLDALVVLATGGARGITAEALRELALPGNALVLTGRSPLVDEADALAALRRRRQRCASISSPQVRGGAARLTPAEIQRKTAAVMARARDARQHRRLPQSRRHGRVPRRRRSRRMRPGASDRRRRSPPRRDQRRRPRRRRDRGQAARRQDAARAGRASSRPRCSGCCCCSATCSRERSASCRCSARSPAASATAASPTTPPPTS